MSTYPGGWGAPTTVDWWSTYSPSFSILTTSIQTAQQVASLSIIAAINALWAMVGILTAKIEPAVTESVETAQAAVNEAQEEVASKSEEAERIAREAGVWVTKEEASLGSGIGHWIVDHLQQAWAWLVDHIAKLLHDFEALLNAIHFKTIMLIIQIASIVSPAFRAVMKKVYDAISRLSKALGFGPEFLILALRNSRTLIMDVSSMLGRSYDIGRVQWLASMNAWMKKAATLFDRYKNHPELVFEDLEEDIEKNFANDGAGAMSGLWGTVAGVTQTLLDTAIDLGKINADLVKLVNDLPETVRKNLPEQLLKWMWEGSWLMQWTVLPGLTNLNTLVGAHAAELLSLRTAATAAAARILAPKDAVKALATLTDAEQAEAAVVLDALQNQRRAAQALALNLGMAPAVAEFDKLLRLAPPVTPPPAVLLLEPGDVPRRELGAFTPRQTWFVGEY